MTYLSTCCGALPGTEVNDFDSTHTSLCSRCHEWAEFEEEAEEEPTCKRCKVNGINFIIQKVGGYCHQCISDIVGSVENG